MCQCCKWEIRKPEKAVYAMYGKCFLCNRPCRTEMSETINGHWFHCLSCGSYALDRKTAVNFNLNDFDKDRASHLAAERRIHRKSSFVFSEADDTTIDIQGTVYPCSSMNKFLRSYPKDTLEILDRTLLNLAHLETFPGETIELNRIDEVDEDGECGEHGEYSKQSIAFTNRWEQQIGIILLLEAEGVIAIQASFKNPAGNEPSRVDREGYFRKKMSTIRIRIQPEGLRRIRELKSITAGDQSQAFVAMWFDHSRTKYYEHIGRAAKEAGFSKCLRIDMKETNDKICDEIIAEIRKSQCLIADFTGNRGGVYFEAGFALGLGIPVIWLVDGNWLNETDENGKRNELHFDTRQYAHIVYENEDDLFKKLKARIAATIPIQK